MSNPTFTPDKVRSAWAMAKRDNDGVWRGQPTASARRGSCKAGLGMAWRVGVWSGSERSGRMRLGCLERSGRLGPGTDGRGSERRVKHGSGANWHGEAFYFFTEVTHGKSSSGNRTV